MSAQKNKSINILVEYEANAIMNIYDIIIYLNGEKLGILEQGQIISYPQTISNIDNKLRITQSDKPDNNYEVEFEVNDDGYYYFTCKAKFLGASIEFMGAIDEEVAIKKLASNENSQTTQSLIDETKVSGGVYYDENLDEWIFPDDKNISDNTPINASFNFHGYVLASKDNMFSGVKLYWKDDPTDPNEEAEHIETVLYWGNETGLFANKTFINSTLATLNKKNNPSIENEWWEDYKDYECYLTDQTNGAILIKEDDPALAKAEKFYKAVEADNYRKITLEEVNRGGSSLNGMDLYLMNPDGKILWVHKIVKYGFNSTDVLSKDILPPHNLITEKIDTLNMLNSYYVKK